jgi:hypothetical protein
MKPTGRKFAVVFLVAAMLFGVVVLSGYWNSRSPDEISTSDPVASADGSGTHDDLSIEEEIDEALASLSVEDRFRLFNDNAWSSPAAATVNDNIAVRSQPALRTARTAEELRKQWESAYRRAQQAKYTTVHACEGCGMTNGRLSPDGHLETHHVISVLRIFNERLNPALIGDPDNLIVLCRGGRYDCHITIGHDPDGPSGPESPNTHQSNPRVRQDAAARLRKLSRRH